MQVLDSLIDGPLELGNAREGDELIGMIVRYLRTGAEPSPRTDAQRMALAMSWPVIKNSRARIVSGRKGGSEPKSKRESEPPSKAVSKQASGTVSDSESETGSKPGSKEVSESASDIYSSSSIPDSSSEEGVQGEEAEAVPYPEIVAALNEAAGTAYRHSSRKTRQLIRARWGEGYRLPDFEAVCRTMAAAWRGDPRMARYLRPETLFGTKFEGYREMARQSPAACGKGARDAYSEL